MMMMLLFMMIDDSLRCLFCEKPLFLARLRRPSLLSWTGTLVERGFPDISYNLHTASKVYSLI